MYGPQQPGGAPEVQVRLEDAKVRGLRFQTGDALPEVRSGEVG